MIVEQNLLSEIKELPENLKEKVALYITKLKTQYSKTNEHIEKPNKRVFGISKGKYVLSDDFDAPLDGFKEYM